MQRTIPIGAATTLAYGSVLINTMPIWLVSLAAKSGSGDTLPGFLASVVLLAAASGCGFGGGLTRKSIITMSALLVAVLPALGVVASTTSTAVLWPQGPFSDWHSGCFCMSHSLSCLWQATRHGPLATR